MKKTTEVLLSIILFELVSLSSQHGFMIEPPARNSMWRHGFNSPPDYNDNELFCGGLQVLLYFVSIFLSSLVYSGSMGD